MQTRFDRSRGVEGKRYAERGNEVSAGNPSTDEICVLLRVARTIAVVGFSPRSHRSSYRIASSLKDAGYRVIPIRPGIHEGLGEQAFPHLDAVPSDVRIDIVDVFRSAEHVPQIVDECLLRGLKILWLQDGIINLREAERARAAGMTVVMDRCILRDYHDLCGKT
jgi:predicted CoA-binding protein